jgi:hypothetical protein
MCTRHDIGIPHELLGTEEKRMLCSPHMIIMCTVLFHACSALPKDGRVPPLVSMKDDAIYYC